MPKSFLLRRSQEDARLKDESVGKGKSISDCEDNVQIIKTNMFELQEEKVAVKQFSTKAGISRKHDLPNSTLDQNRMDSGQAENNMKSKQNNFHFLLAAARQLMFNREEHQNLGNLDSKISRKSLKSITNNSDIVTPSVDNKRLISVESKSEENNNEGDDDVYYSDDSSSSISNTESADFVDINDNEYSNPSKKSKYQCDQCGKVFKTRYTLNIHLKMPYHTKSRPFVCSVCGKGFRLSSTLCRHKIIHTKDKPHGCHLCSKAFNRSSTLKTHIKTHSNIKEFKCQVCGKGFHQKGNLRNHALIHTGEKPYTCHICDKAFNKLCNLKFHLQTHEQQTEATET